MDKADLVDIVDIVDNVDSMDMVDNRKMVDSIETVILWTANIKFMCCQKWAKLALNQIDLIGLNLPQLHLH